MLLVKHLLENCTLALKEEIECDMYKKVIFYDVMKKPELTQTISMLEKSTKSNLLK